MHFAQRKATLAYLEGVIFLSLLSVKAFLILT